MNKNKERIPTKEIIACVCRECGDTWNYSKLISEDKECDSEHWRITPKICLKCGKNIFHVKIYIKWIILYITLLEILMGTKQTPFKTC